MRRGTRAALVIGAASLTIGWIAATRVLDAGDPRAVRQIVDRRGVVLAEQLPTRFGWRVPTTAAQIAPILIDQVVAQEDRRFWYHPGVDPIALARAVWRNLRAGRVIEGGSTITQQLAKMYLENWLGRAVPRTLGWKLAEAAVALRLEARFKKSVLLEQYLNNIYFGARSYGVEAAALTYFGKSAQDLRAAEIASLVARIRRPNVGAAPVGAAWTPDALAPHLLTLLPADAPARATTTLDANVQRAAQTAVRRTLERLRDRAPQVQAAAVVIDVAAGELRALVGSDDYGDAMHDGAVNYATALRQPGSALKPFTYYLAFVHGYAPTALVADEPYQFLLAGGRSYMPQNFDRQFRGLVSLREALGNSLNVPAVLMLSQLGVNGLLATLREYGFTSLGESPSHYGLSLTLGSGAVSLLELTNAYAALARGGEFAPLCWRSECAAPLSTHNVYRAAAAQHVTAILSDPNARMRQFGDAMLMQLDDQPVAVKTGTSNGARDAWAVGYTPRYAVGVWVGHPDNSPMPGLTGAKAAVPMWHDIMRGLHAGLPVVAFEKSDATRLDGSNAGKMVRSISSSLRLIAPLHGAVYQLDDRRAAVRQQVRVEVRVPSDVAGDVPIAWRVDDVEIARTAQSQPRIFVPLTPGTHRVTAQIGARTARAVEYRVVGDERL